MQIPRLREWREARALTQVELADRAGVSERSVAGYEAGGGARPPTVRKLAEALGVEVLDLMEETARPKVLRPRSREELLSNAGIRSRWMLMPEEEFRGWWRGASYEEARRRSEEIEAEYRVLEKATNDAIDPDREGAAKITPELRAELYGAWAEMLPRKMAASGEDPDVRESEEDFYARQREGKRLSYESHKLEEPRRTPRAAS